MDYKGIQINREDAIRCAYLDRVQKKGMSSGNAVRETADEFGLSRQRIYQILRK